MNLNLKWGAALVLALATIAAPAMARDDHRDRRGSHYSHRGDHDRGRNDRHRDYGRYDRSRANRQHRGDRRGGRDVVHARHYRAPARVVHHRPVVRNVYLPAPRYAPPPPRWARGGYLHHYQRPVYVVNDYRGYGLRHPPRGYRWVRDDYGDLLLVAIATGLITDLILHH